MRSEPIRFYGTRSRYGWMSNFSPHPITLDRRAWPTVEHYFQAMKSLDPDRQEEIRLAPTPAAAKKLGRRSALRSDWLTARDDVMRLAVRIKFETHPDLRAKLLETGDAVLIENAPRDRYWGCGADGTGRNRLGQILMEVRATLPA